jgi:hypothetical protein
MPSLTDGAIRHAIKRVERKCKQTMLSDGEAAAQAAALC